MTKYILMALSLALISSCAEEQSKAVVSEINYVDLTKRNRSAAEWEPALGTLIVWPLAIPHTLVIELAGDNHLYLMLEDETARKEAETWFREWDIDITNVTFIYAEQGIDAWWTRDWGPSAVFTTDGQFKLADGKYIYATPLTDLDCNDTLEFLYYDENGEMILTRIDDDATLPLTQQLGLDIMDLPINNTGGNVLTDGLGTAFSTCVILAENEYHGIGEDAFLGLNDSLLGFKEYNIISNFEMAGIQHIDCYLKLIDEETLLVAQTPEDHELYKVYEDIITDELSKLRTPFNRPYTIQRIKTAPYRDDRLAAYTNSIIINNTVYVPLFNIAQDKEALKTWEAVMPGYQVKGFTFALDDEPVVTSELRDHYRDYGWNDGDALHCRTRAIWDPDMLFIAIKKVSAKIQSGMEATVYTSIIDYSAAGLTDDSHQLHWRTQGSMVWNSKTLMLADSPNNFFATIPAQSENTIIEYYVEAKSKSGRTARRPATAPEGFYTFKFVVE